MSPCVSWDVAPPRDRNLEATSLVTTANAITLMAQALEGAGGGRRLDVGEMASRFGIPILGDMDGDGMPDEAADEEPDNVIDVEFEDVADEEPEQDAAE